MSGKRSWSPADPEHDVCKRPRHTGSPVEGVTRTPMNSTMLGNRATSPDTSWDHGDDVSGELSPHGTERSLAHQATPVEAGVSAQAHADLILEVNRLRETFTQTQSLLDAVQTRLQVLEQQQPRMEGKLDVLIRMLQRAAQPPFSAQALPHPRSSGRDMA